MRNHNNVKYGNDAPLAIGQRLRCKMHPKEVYEVVAVEAGMAGISMDRVQLRQIRLPGARRPAKTDLIARVHLEEAYELLGACR